jgi:hypothetical protein
MKLIYPKFTSLFVFLLTSIFICSCGTDESESPADANQTAFDEDLHSESAADSDSFFDEGETFFPSTATGAEDPDPFLSEEETFFPSTATGTEGFSESSPDAEVDGSAHLGSDPSGETPALLGEPVGSKSVLADHEAEKALSDLEEGTISHQRSIDELRKINSRKDRTIASLTKLNQELVTEVIRLKGKGAEQPVSALKPDESASDKLFGLRSEVKNLRGNLHIKSKEIQDLRIRNDSLEERISVLELNPSKKLSDSGLSPRQKDLSRVVSSLSAVDPVVDTVKETRLFSGGCNLQFDAVVTALNGKNKEAFYTEFFIIDEDVEDVLRKGGIKLADFSGIDSYAELWARSRKNSFLFPNVQKNIRSLLLKLVENGQGQRVRTDINGAATLENLPPGKFFVVGTASLGKIGVTWDVPVVLRAGANKLSLTLANASWSL